jgi:hypothetical protein
MKTLNDVLSKNEALFQQEALILEATELISSVMEANGVTKAELARKLKKSKAFVTQCLSGDQNLTLRTLADILTALQYQAQLGAVPCSSEQVSKAVLRLYPVGAWAYEKASSRQLTIPCAALGEAETENEPCVAA